MFLIPLLFTINIYATLFPEDGSGIAIKWYRGDVSNIQDYERLRLQMKALGLKEKIAPTSYQWIEDMMLISYEGRYFDQTFTLGGEIDKELLQVTRGLFSGISDEPGPVKKLLGQSLGLESKQMKASFIEGGELISGTFSNGESYAIIRNTVVSRTRRILAYRRFGAHDWQTQLKVSIKEAKKAIASDLEIKEENLFSLQSPGHLDLFMKAMPNGVLIIHKSELVIPTIKKILAGPIDLNERKRLEKMLEKYRNGEKKGDFYFPMEAKAYQKQYDDIAKDLSDRFEIIRLAGFFKESREGEQINFLNGISATTSEGVKFYLTNDAKGLHSLEKYFLDFMLEHSYEDWHIDFVFSSGDGDGLDCAVVLAP